MLLGFGIEWQQHITGTVAYGKYTRFGVSSNTNAHLSNSVTLDRVWYSFKEGRYHLYFRLMWGLNEVISYVTSCLNKACNVLGICKKVWVSLFFLPLSPGREKIVTWSVCAGNVSTAANCDPRVGPSASGPPGHLPQGPACLPQLLRQGLLSTNSQLAQARAQNSCPISVVKEMCWRNVYKQKPEPVCMASQWVVGVQKLFL